MQSILTSAINIIVLSFLSLMAFDFVVGLCVKTRRGATQREQPVQPAQPLAKQLAAEQSGETLSKQSILSDPLPDLWVLGETEQQLEVPLQPIAAETVKENVQKCLGETSPSLKVQSQSDKLNFEKVCTDFAKLGFKLERHRSGRHKYKVTNSSDAPCQFKKLQEAMDWLVNEQTVNCSHLISPHSNKQQALLSIEQVQAG